MSEPTTHSVPTAAVPTAAVPVHPGRRPAIRVADADREHVAERLRTAATEGRLSLAEADERQAQAYAALTMDELRPLVADLPAPTPVTDRTLTEAARRRLTIHVAIVSVLALLMITGAVIGLFVGGPGTFLPIGPLFFMALSVLVHRRVLQRRSAEERRRLAPAI